MTRLRLLTLLTALLLVTTACADDGAGGEAASGDAGTDTAEPAGTEPGDAGEDREPTEGADAGGGDLGSVALIVAQGGLGDESYNDLAFEGFERALADAGVEGTPIESDDIVAQGEQVLRRAAETDFGLVIDLEFAHGEILGPVAADYPDVQWAIFNLEVEGDNVASVLFEEQQGSYLAGALAARMTRHTEDPRINEEPVIGVIGGTKSVGIDKFIVGYMQGARDTDPDVEVLVSYADDFGDPARGQQLAQAMFDQGADIVYHVAGGTGAGVIEAADAAERYAIGVDTDQDDLAPGSVLTSMIKRVDVAVEELITRYAGGDYPAGETLSLGLAEDGVGLSEMEHTREQVPEEFLQEVEDLRQQIIDGELEVWNVVEQGYPDFFS